MPPHLCTAVTQETLSSSGPPARSDAGGRAGLGLLRLVGFGKRLRSDGSAAEGRQRFTYAIDDVSLMITTSGHMETLTVPLGALRVPHRPEVRGLQGAGRQRGNGAAWRWCACTSSPKSSLPAKRDALRRRVQVVAVCGAPQ